MFIHNPHIHLSYGHAITEGNDDKHSSDLTKKHLARVLDELLNLHKEGDGFPTIEEAVIVGKSEIHHLHNSLALEADLTTKFDLQGGSPPCR